MPIQYDFAKEYTDMPGDDEFTGEHFRKTILEGWFKNNSEVIINMDGLKCTLTPAFIMKSFGYMAVEYGKDKLNRVILDVYSNHNSFLRDKIRMYVDTTILDAYDSRKKK